MITIHLLGTLGEKFGTEWKAEVSSVSDAIKLISCQTVGFKKYLIERAESGVNFGIKHGEELLETDDDLVLPIIKDDLYITEVPAGAAGTNPWSKVIIGAALIAASFIPGFQGAYPFLADAAFAVGISFVMQGIAQILVPGPQNDKNKDNYYFNGPINTLRQGQPVPILYGELIVGGAPISVNYTKRVLNSSGFIYNTNDEDGTGGGSFDGATDLTTGA